MEAHEVWWQKTGVNQRTMRFKSGLVLDKAYRTGIKDGWRASLEWVKEKLKLEIEPGDIGYFIEKELEG